MCEAFTKAWLKSDTSFHGMSPDQYKRLRKLCKRFFDAGQRTQALTTGDDCIDQDPIRRRNETHQSDSD